MASGVLLAIVLVFFFVKDGHGMVRAVLSPLPPERRRLARAAADKAWWTLSRWVRGTVLVALIDAAGIGGGLLLLNVPLALPLALLTFLGAFVPIIGALVAVPLSAALTAGAQAFLAEQRRPRARERGRTAEHEGPAGGADAHPPVPH